MPKTLLLADDSVTIQRVIELTFAHEDVRVVSVSDGRRAVDWMDSESPDVVLVDVEVPEVDGYEVAAHMKSSPRLKHVPVLLLAGVFEPVDENRARAIGCDGVLVKPFEPQQLVSRVKSLLARSPGETTPRDLARREELATVTQFPGPHGARGSEAATATMLASHALPSLDPEPLEPPTRPVWEGAAPPVFPGSAKTVEAAPAPAPAKVSLVSAFSALLAAEQSSPSAPAPSSQATVTEATVEDAVRRVLVRMTDDLVRRIVVETAERLIREEIDKIKSTPE